MNRNNDIGGAGLATTTFDWESAGKKHDERKAIHYELVKIRNGYKRIETRLLADRTEQVSGES